MPTSQHANVTDPFGCQDGGSRRSFRWKRHAHGDGRRSREPAAATQGVLPLSSRIRTAPHIFCPPSGGDIVASRRDYSGWAPSMNVVAQLRAAQVFQGHDTHMTWRLSGEIPRPMTGLEAEELIWCAASHSRPVSLMLSLRECGSVLCLAPTQLSHPGTIFTSCCRLRARRLLPHVFKILCNIIESYPRFRASDVAGIARSAAMPDVAGDHVLTQRSQFCRSSKVAHFSSPPKVTSARFCALKILTFSLLPTSADTFELLCLQRAWVEVMEAPLVYSYAHLLGLF